MLPLQFLSHSSKNCLVSIKYPGGGEFINKLLSSCPILEDLFVVQSQDDNVPILSVRVPSLERLVVHKSGDIVVAEPHGFVIDAPSLEFVDVFDDMDEVFVVYNNMPKIVEAKVILSYGHPEDILGSITSAKHLCLCVKNAYLVGSIFCCLVSLSICTCESEWLNLLMRLLKDSPKLRALKFESALHLKL